MYPNGSSYYAPTAFGNLTFIYDWAQDTGNDSCVGVCLTFAEQMLGHSWRPGCKYMPMAIPHRSRKESGHPIARIVGNEQAS